MSNQRQGHFAEEEQRKAVGSLLSEARRNAIGELTQEEVAWRASEWAEEQREEGIEPYASHEPMEVSRTFLAQLEQGRYWGLRTWISRQRLRAVAAVLNVPWVEILLKGELLTTTDLERAGWKRIPIQPADVVYRVCRYLVASKRLSEQEANTLIREFCSWNGWTMSARLDERIQDPE